MCLGKINGLLDVLGRLSHNYEGGHPLVLVVPVVERLVGGHAGHQLVIVSVGDEGVGHTIWIRSMVNTTLGVLIFELAFICCQII